MCIRGLRYFILCFIHTGLHFPIFPGTLSLGPCFFKMGNFCGGRLFCSHGLAYASLWLRQGFPLCQAFSSPLMFSLDVFLGLGVGTRQRWGFANFCSQHPCEVRGVVFVQVEDA
jgi:hypothetical protein